MTTDWEKLSYRERATFWVVTWFMYVLNCGCYYEASDPSSDGSDDTVNEASEVESSGATTAISTSASAATEDLESSSTEVGSSDDGESSGTGGVGPLPEPRAIWQFDGDMVEEIASADATAIGLVSFASSPWGEAATPGTSAYIDASAAGPLVLEHKDAFSILMRVRLNDHSGNQILWSLGPASHMAAERNAMAFSAYDGVLHLFTETATAQVHEINIATAPAVGQWVEMVVVIDAGFIRIFYDGEIAGTAPFVPVDTQTTEFYLGGLLNTADPAQTISLHGAIDEVRLWDVALADEHVAEIAE